MSLAFSSAVGLGAAIVWGWCHTVVQHIWRAKGSEAAVFSTNVPSSFGILFFYPFSTFHKKTQKPTSTMHWSEEIQAHFHAQLYCTPNDLVLITLSQTDLPARGMGRGEAEAGRGIPYAALNFFEKRWDRNRTQFSYQELMLEHICYTLLNSLSCLFFI